MSRGERAGPFATVVDGVGWVVAVGLAVLVLARLAGLERGPVWSLGMGLLPYVLLLAFPLLVGAVLRRRQVLATVALLLGLAQVLVAAPSTAGRPGPCLGTPLRVVGSNLLYTNPTPGAAARALAGAGPDLVVLPELTERARPSLAPLLDALPQQAIEIRAGATSPGLVTRLPLTDVTEVPRSERFWPEGTIEVDAPGGSIAVRVLGVHTQPPLLRGGDPWASDLEHVAGRLREIDGPAIALGDFNASRDFASFRKLLSPEVRDAHEDVGAGLARTWPARLPVLHLDHVLVKDGGGVEIDVCSVRQLRVPGSDHLAVVADLAVRRAR